MDEINRKASKIRLTVNPDKQARYIFGTPEYKEALKNRKVKPSYFIISPKELDDIIQKRADRNMLSKTNNIYGPSEHLMFIKIVKTTRMKVMQSKNVYHAVPAPPKSQEKKK